MEEPEAVKVRNAISQRSLRYGWGRDLGQRGEEALVEEEGVISEGSY
jgi:hypothetical protein